MWAKNMLNYSSFLIQKSQKHLSAFVLFLFSILGPNIEKSVKDLQRCTVSLTRYRMTIKEEVDNSVKKIKAAFAELHSW